MNKASNICPRRHQICVLAQGLDDVTLPTKSQEEVPENSGDEEHLPVITFILGILVRLYNR